MARQKKRMRRMSLHYISSLGIFATILVSAFTLLTFSKEALERAGSQQFQVLAFIIVLAGFVLLLMLEMLFRFISRINRIAEVRIEDWAKGIFIGLIMVLGLWAHAVTSQSAPDAMPASGCSVAVQPGTGMSEGASRAGVMMLRG